MSQDEDDNRPEFSVYWWDASGGQHRELSFVFIKEAIAAADRLMHGPASILKIVHRVLITDGMDKTCFNWTIEDDVTFPPKPGAPEQ